MQADDDERRDLERALYGRPSGGADGETRRREAARRLRPGSEEEADAPDPVEAATPTGVDEAPAEEEAPPRRRRAHPILVVAALLGGLAVGATAASLPLNRVDSTASPSPSENMPPREQLAVLLEGWTVTADLPVGMSLISRGAEVYTPQFATAQDDRLLLTSPNETSLCLGLQRDDGTVAAGCTGLDAFFDAGSLDVVSTATGDGTPVYTRVTLRSDGTIEGGFQLVQAPESTPPSADEP